MIVDENKGDFSWSFCSLDDFEILLKWYCCCWDGWCWDCWHWNCCWLLLKIAMDHCWNLLDFMKTNLSLTYYNSFIQFFFTFLSIFFTDVFLNFLSGIFLFFFSLKTKIKIGKRCNWFFTGRAGPSPAQGPLGALESSYSYRYGVKLGLTQVPRPGSGQATQMDKSRFESLDVTCM